MPKLNDTAKGPEIEAALDDLVLGWPDVTTGKMFGSRAYRANGVLSAMIGGSGLILTKLNDAQRQQAAEENDGHAFVGRGKELPGWTAIALEGAARLAAVSPMVRAAYENALAEAE